MTNRGSLAKAQPRLTKEQPRRADVTIKDIAIKLGMSHATVSRALNDHPATSARTKVLVQQTAEALGYIRNANALTLQGAASRWIGFITPDVQNEFYAIVAKVLADKCSKAGFQLALSISEDEPELEYQHILAMRQARAAGVVITPTAGLLKKTVDLLAPIPTVQLVRSNPRLNRTWVGIDDHEGLKLATEHLLRLGHRRIGFVGGFKTLTTGRDRRDGYDDALTSFKMPVDESLVRMGPPRAAFGLEATLSLTEMRPRITALVVGGPQLTLGALQAFQHQGLSAPSDLSIVGYSDPEWFSIWGPGLTTIGLPAQEIAAAAAAKLFEDINPTVKHKRKDIIFKPELVIRGSATEVSGGERRSRPIPS